jgi:hypothetical protein
VTDWDRDCELCPGICRRPGCPFALRTTQLHPGTDEDELGAAHEPFELDGE